MMTMGLKSSVYWTSWIVNGLFFTVVADLITVGIGNLYGFGYFTDTAFGINFIIFWFAISSRFHQFSIQNHISEGLGAPRGLIAAR